MMNNSTKIFGIGYSKTGTTSLTCALKCLGFNAQHFPFHVMDHGADKLVLQWSKLWRSAYTDTPIPLFFRELDQRFPGSRFILTMRETKRWIRSCERNHIWPGDYIPDNAIRKLRYIRTILNLHRELYGSASFHRQKFQRSYDLHNAKVLEYFRDRPNDLLVLDICDGDGWEKLCPFLNRPVRRDAFPRANVGVDKYLKRNCRKYFWKGIRKLNFGAPNSPSPPKYEPE